MPREVVVVVNRHSRRTSHDLDRIHRLLDSNALRVAAFHVAADHTELRRHVKRAAKAGAPAILVGGGDGTMAHAVDVLAHRKTVLGVLPLGTGNSFARSLGLDPHDLESAVATVARGMVGRIDLGSVNGTHFANFATIGLSSEIAAATPTSVKSWSGPLAYALAAVRPLFAHKAFRAKIRWRGGRLDLRTEDIIVANGRFFGATPVTPDATLVDGRLALFTSDDASRAGALKTYIAFGLNRQATLRGAHAVTAAKFEIRTRSRQWISIDGSLLERTPATFRVARRALRVYLPEDGVAHG